VIVRVGFDGAVSSATTVAGATGAAGAGYDGVLRAACSPDGHAMYVVGNGTNSPSLFYAAHGAAAPAALPALTKNADHSFTGCTVTASGALLLLRSTQSKGFVDRVAAPLPLGAAALLPAVSTASFNSVAYSAKQIVANRAENVFFVAVSTSQAAADGGMYRGTSATGAMSLHVAASYRITGLALSTDEATVFFTARAPTHALYSVKAAECLILIIPTTCIPTLLLPADAGAEFRGVVLAPQPVPSPSSTPTPTPSSSMGATQSTSPTTSKTPSPSPTLVQAPCAAGQFKNASAPGGCQDCPAGRYSSGEGAASCLSCPAGYFASPAARATKCSLCAPGTSSAVGAAACAPCPAGQACFPGYASMVCPATGGCTGAPAPAQNGCLCIAGYGFVGSPQAAPGCKPCPPGAANPVNGSLTCTCAAANSVWDSVANACTCAPGFSSLGLTSGAGLVCQPASSCAASCAAGFFVSAPCSAASDTACSACAHCGDGMAVQTACSATANTICAACAPGMFAAPPAGGGDVLPCAACAAGSAPNAAGNGCVCAAPGSAWDRAANSCACTPGFLSGGTSGAGLVCTADLAFTASATPSATPSKTGSASKSATITPSITGSLSTSASVSATPSPTPSGTSAASVSSKASASGSKPPAPSPGTSASAAASPSASAPASASPSVAALGNTAAGAGAAAAAPSSGAAIFGGVGGALALAAVAAIALLLRRQQAQKLDRAASASGGAWGNTAAETRVHSPLPPRNVVAASEWIECRRLSDGKVWYANAANPSQVVWSLPLGGMIVRKMQS